MGNLSFDLCLRRRRNKPTRNAHVDIAAHHAEELFGGKARIRASRASTRRRSSAAAARASAPTSSRMARSSSASTGWAGAAGLASRSTTCNGSRAHGRRAQPTHQAAPRPRSPRSWRASTARFTQGTPRAPAWWKPSRRSTVRSTETGGAAVDEPHRRPALTPVGEGAAARHRGGVERRSGTARPSGRHAICPFLRRDRARGQPSARARDAPVRPGPRRRRRRPPPAPGPRPRTGGPEPDLHARRRPEAKRALLPACRWRTRTARPGPSAGAPDTQDGLPTPKRSAEASSPRRPTTTPGRLGCEARTGAGRPADAEAAPLPHREAVDARAVPAPRPRSPTHLAGPGRPGRRSSTKPAAVPVGSRSRSPGTPASAFGSRAAAATPRTPGSARRPTGRDLAELRLRRGRRGSSSGPWPVGGGEERRPPAPRCFDAGVVAGGEARPEGPGPREQPAELTSRCCTPRSGFGVRPAR